MPLLLAPTAKLSIQDKTMDTEDAVASFEHVIVQERVVGDVRWLAQLWIARLHTTARRGPALRWINADIRPYRRWVSSLRRRNQHTLSHTILSSTTCSRSFSVVMARFRRRDCIDPIQAEPTGRTSAWPCIWRALRASWVGYSNISLWRTA